MTLPRPTRRRWFVPLGLVGALVVVTLATTQGCATFGGFPDGPRLARMQSSLHWREGRFVNAEPTSVMQEGSASTMWQWFSSDVMRTPSCALPLVSPRAALSSPSETGLRVTWLGHSTTLIELDGFTILTDPMFSERASPSSIAGPRRFHPPPLSLDELPRVDAVIVSHDHYDHLDMASVQALAKRGVPIHVGLGAGAHLEAWGVAKAQIVELEWWEERTLPGGLVIASTPARHFTGRRGFGNDRVLWTSWTLVGPKHRVYFSGDTGLTEQFRAVKEKYGPLDLAMLEIGQWHPSWGSIHLGPKGALEAHAMLGATHLLPIHWATFELGLHAWNEPPETLVTEAAKTNTSVVTPRLGEPVEPLRGDTGSTWWRSLPPLASACP